MAIKNYNWNLDQFGLPKPGTDDLNYASGFGNIGDGSMPPPPPTNSAPPAGPPNDMNQPGYGGPPPPPTYGQPPYGGPRNGSVLIPGTPEFEAWLQQHSGQNTQPNPYSDGSGVPITGTNKPNGVDFSSPTKVPALTNTQPAPPPPPPPPPPGVVGTGIDGTDPTKPPAADLENWFYSGTAHHWVDKTGQRDATGRHLSDAEKQYWNGQNTLRAQQTAAGERYMMPTDAMVRAATGQPDPAAAAVAPAAPAPAAPAAPAGPPPPPTTAALPQGAAAYPGAISGNSNYQFQQGVDYSKFGAIQGADFQKNAYAQANANVLPQELDPNTALKGGLNDQNLQALMTQFGYQIGKLGYTDYNQALRDLYAVGAKNPSTDFYLVPQASGGYGILARERTVQGQLDAGFTPPWMPQPKPAAAPTPLAGGGGGGGNGGPTLSTAQSTPARPAPPAPYKNPGVPPYALKGGSVDNTPGSPNYPVGSTTRNDILNTGLNPAQTNIQPGPTLNPAAVGQINTQGASDSAPEGSITTYNGQTYQKVNGRWVPIGSSKTPGASTA